MAHAFEFASVLFGLVSWLAWCAEMASVANTAMLAAAWVSGNACARCCRRNVNVVPTRTVSTQSQVTYKRHYTQPKFQPLADGDHGAWVQPVAES